MMVTTVWDSPLGPLTLAAENGEIAGLWMAGQKHFGAGAENAAREDDAPPFDAVRAWLRAYFAGEKPDPASLPLAPRGTAFQRRVWRELMRIPYGQVMTYGELAQRLGSSARAVGGAVGRNPISILIPCHRVIGADGSLAGYAGGVENKRRLLAMEGNSQFIMHNAQL